MLITCPHCGGLPEDKTSLSDEWKKYSASDDMIMKVVHYFSLFIYLIAFILLIVGFTTILNLDVEDVNTVSKFSGLKENVSNIIIAVCIISGLCFILLKLQATILPIRCGRWIKAHGMDIAPFISSAGSKKDIKIKNFFKTPNANNYKYLSTAGYLAYAPDDERLKISRLITDTILISVSVIFLERFLNDNAQAYLDAFKSYLFVSSSIRYEFQWKMLVALAVSVLIYFVVDFCFEYRFNKKKDVWLQGILKDKLN